MHTIFWILVPRTHRAQRSDTPYLQKKDDQNIRAKIPSRKNCKFFCIVSCSKNAQYFWKATRIPFS